MDFGNSLIAVNQSDEADVPAVPITEEEDNSNISCLDFLEVQKDFLFGAATASYQVEGAYNVDGRGLSNWDDFCLTNPANIQNGSNGNVACDSYHKFKEDITNMKKTGFTAYRFSISWSRILPGGRISAGINKEGLNFYNEVIDTLIANGMTPHVTLFHFDLPLILEKEYDGFLSKNILKDFYEYAELCFSQFGDRVKLWTTINEPWTYAVNGYVRGIFPPGKISSPPDPVVPCGPTTVQAHRSAPIHVGRAQAARFYSDIKYDKSDPAKDAYTVGRNLLLAHAHAVHLYRTKFKYQGGKIGIVNCSQWCVPLHENSDDDKAAAKRAIDFMLGWFLDPVLYGRYPQNMIDFVPPENLAPFSHTESHLLKGSVDFIGFNYYTATYASNDPNPTGVGYSADQHVIFRPCRDGVPIGRLCSGSTWLYICPWGIYDHLVYIKENYSDVVPMPPIYITENGVSDKNDPTLTAREACSDPERVKYYQDHLANVLKAMKKKKDGAEGVDVRGYFAWAYCDNFEWMAGYSARFGIVYIDYLNNQARHLKDSAVWFAKFMTKHRFKKTPLLTNKRQNKETPEKTPGKRARSVIA